MIWWPIFFLLNVFADDPSVERYCYSSQAEMQATHARAKAVFVPSDNVTEDDACLVVQMRPHRRELIQSYLRRLNPNVNISFSSAEIRREPCKLKVEKVRNTNSHQVSGAVNAQSGAISTQTNTSSGADVMQITTLNDFAFEVNYEGIKGTCRYITPTRYEISLEVKKDAVPLVQGLPPGSAVIVGMKELPPNQETSKLQTTIQLNQGERIEIGSLIKDLRKKSYEISGSPSASGEITDGANTEKVFLSIH